MVTDEFAKKNPKVSRTIQIRGDQTLEDLHNAIFHAFDRFDEHLCEFQFGERPMDEPRYVLAFAQDDGDKPPAGFIEDTTIDSLGLTVGDAFLYWFDFGDDWWHRIEVLTIEPNPPSGKFPRITKRVGASPPQYLDVEE